MQTMTKKGLRLFYSEDEGDSSDDGNKMALATVTTFFSRFMYYVIRLFNLRTMQLLIEFYR